MNNISIETLKASIESIEAEIEEDDYLSPSMELDALAVLAARKAMLKAAEEAAENERNA